MWELPVISRAEGVLVAKQTENLGDVALNALGLGIVRLRKAKALSIEGTALVGLRINLGVVDNLGDVEERLLVEVVPSPREATVNEET